MNTAVTKIKLCLWRMWFVSSFCSIRFFLNFVQKDWNGMFSYFLLYDPSFRFLVFWVVFFFSFECWKSGFENTSRLGRVYFLLLLYDPPFRLFGIFGCSLFLFTFKFSKYFLEYNKKLVIICFLHSCDPPFRF